MRKKFIKGKEAWGRGPWETEYDFITWIDEVTSYPCIMRRNQYAAWCGFVGLHLTHALFMLDIKQSCWSSIDVHGGVGAAGFDRKFDLEFSPPQRQWWIGFNCSGKHDYSPQMKNQEETDKKKYRTMEYVKAEVEELARQLKLFEKDGYINE